MPDIGSNIRYLLTKQKKSARDLAKHLGYTEVGLQGVMNRENLDSHVLLKVAEFFGLPAWVFLEDKIEKVSQSDITKEPKPEYTTTNKNSIELENLRNENRLLKELIKNKDELLQLYLNKETGKL
jgi:transcriptional regulator with XRE-family HTH domain